MDDVKVVKLPSEVKIGFDYRAVVEMINTIKGTAPIQRRLESLFNVREYKIYNKNIRRSGGWAARAIAIGSFDLNTILRMGTNINNFGIVKDDMSWRVYDKDDNPKVVIKKDCNIIQILYSSNSLTAEISIVTTFRDTVTVEYFEEHKEELYKIFDEKIGSLASFISIVKDCKFTNRTYKEFMGNLSDIITYSDITNTDPDIDSHFNTDTKRTLAKEYFTLNNTLCPI